MLFFVIIMNYNYSLTICYLVFCHFECKIRLSKLKTVTTDFKMKCLYIIKNNILYEIYGSILLLYCTCTIILYCITGHLLHGTLYNVHVVLYVLVLYYTIHYISIITGPHCPYKEESIPQCFYMHSY